MINSIEAVQRTFTRRILQNRDRISYWERLKQLHIYSLEQRKERYIIVYLVKIINNRVPNPGIEFKNNPRTGFHIIPPKSKPACPPWVARLHRVKLSTKGSKIFNCLPTELRAEEVIRRSPDSYKRQLDRQLPTANT